MTPAEHVKVFLLRLIAASVYVYPYGLEPPLCATNIWIDLVSEAARIESGCSS